jgi:hypothetical protein
MSAGRRVVFGGAALLSLLLGGVGVFVVAVMDDLRRAPGALSGGMFWPFVLVILGTAAAFGALSGLAIAPERVLARGDAPGFAIGAALACLALVLAVPSPLALFTWPLAVVAMVGAVTLLRRVLRRQAK